MLNTTAIETNATAVRRPRIVIPASEHTRLVAIAEAAQARDVGVSEYLLEELSRAFIVPDAQCASNVVRIGSTVTYREDVSGRIRTVTVVFPQLADISASRISILTPVGAALIGMSPAQTIQWPRPDGAVESLTVLNVQNE